MSDFLSILIVDDDPLDQTLLIAGLEGLYQVYSARNGIEALRLLAQRSFDVVLLDLLMPEMDGYQTLERIKEHPVWRSIPVIIISAMDDLESITNCIEMGAIDYLTKPFNPVLLHARLNASIANKRLHDIELAARKQVEEERSRLKAVIASSRDGLIMVGEDGLLHVVNRQAMEMLRLPAEMEDHVGRSFVTVFRYIHRWSKKVASTLIKEARKSIGQQSGTSVGEYEFAGRYVRWMNLPMTGANLPTGRLIVLRDVTEERQLEHLREDLTHTLVHDLRNPLGNIRTSLDILAAEFPIPQETYPFELLNIARNCATRMLDLVNAILDVSHFEDRQMPLNRQRISLYESILEALLLQTPIAQEKGILLQTDLAESAPPVWADKVLVRRVLQNLIGNAIKFTHPGGLVGIRTEQVGNELRFSVQDNGPGVAPEIQDRLFQKFVTGRVEGHGSGLGLAFCRLVIEAHGGQIGVLSTPGKGSTFVFTLPIAAKQQKLTAEPKS
jgi:signal transduction histidine kinase